MNAIKSLVNDYCIFAYKWKDEIKNKIKHIDKLYFKKINNSTINIIEVNVNNPFFKIIKLTVYKLHNNCLNLNDFTIIDINHLNTIINYIDNCENMNTISKFTLNICENNNILTIMDNKYNILKINDLLEQDKDYKPATCIISHLVKNILTF